MKKLFLLVFIAFWGILGTVQANSGFELTVRVSGYPAGEQLRLGQHHTGRQLLLADTAVFDRRRGTWTFRRDEPLEGGMYMLVSFSDGEADGTAELIIDKNQRFSVEINHPFNAENIANMRFRNSPENQVFQDLNVKTRAWLEESRNVQRELEAIEDKTSPEAEALQERGRAAWEKTTNARNQFMADNPDHLVTVFWRSQTPIDVPEAPDYIPEDERQSWRYNYWKDNFFANFDLTDSRLFRMPFFVFQQRLNEYLETVLSPHSDSIISGVVHLIEQTRENMEIFRFTLSEILNNYLRSQIVGYDAIWVYLIDRYYATGKASWTSEATMENLLRAANRARPLLAGNVPAEFLSPDLNEGQPNGQWRSVFGARTRYTVVFFWESTCGHCKREMPLLRDFYNAKRKELDFEVFAVCRDRNLEVCWNYLTTNNMTDWINVTGTASTVQWDELWDVNSVPTIFVLDSQNRIVTKRISVEQIEPFIRNWNALHYSD